VGAVSVLPGGVQVQGTEGGVGDDDRRRAIVLAHHDDVADPGRRANQLDKALLDQGTAGVDVGHRRDRGRS
jgi:hypothetical protein